MVARSLPARWCVVIAVAQPMRVVSMLGSRAPSTRAWAIHRLVGREASWPSH